MEIVMKFNDAFWVIHVFLRIVPNGDFWYTFLSYQGKIHHFQSNSISPKSIVLQQKKLEFAYWENRIKSCFITIFMDALSGYVSSLQMMQNILFNSFFQRSLCIQVRFKTTLQSTRYNYVGNSFAQFRWKPKKWPSKLRMFDSPLFKSPNKFPSPKNIIVMDSKQDSKISRK